MGNLIFGTTTVQGRTFDDIKIQTSKAGVPRPIVFGRARPIVGNIIATTSPRIVAVREEQDGGKGGPSVEVENEEVYRTYAIRICEGPVTGIRRVWRNNELVYDRDSTDPTQLENNAAFLEKADFFLGGYDQMPSAVMQSAFGMDNVHAYRGTCYMVVDDENLTATGGAIPQYAFEVERSEGFVLTSKPYPLENIESLGIAPLVKSVRAPRMPTEFLAVEPLVLGVDVQTTAREEYAVPAHDLAVEPLVLGVDVQTTAREEYAVPAHDLAVEPLVLGVDVRDITVDYADAPQELDIEPLVAGINIQPMVDPYFDSVSLLMHFDGGNGSTTFTDSSNSGSVFSATGNARLYTADRRFGTACLQTNGGYIEGPTSNYWAFGTDDFTVELWIKPDSLGTSGYYDSPIGNWVPLNGWCFFIRPTGAIQFQANNSHIVSGPSVISAGGWHAIRFSRVSGDGYLFVDGVLVASGSLADDITSSAPVRIGCNGVSSTDVFEGLIDEVRITNGVGRSTSNYTPSSNPFPNQ
ncbi:LamG domain-containing protein [Microbulbifer thermotolerans]|uniref:LamG domain-containing protein n=1 Tax=Microbulbifer thermotolerans TaxID=252514 RepID=UPI002672F6B6|nr:LamG domain-containing protein [Microbulbifer thermotolerans]WKT59099.1 LamG domain-containing protein [Microbulbifer thermotolerans]